MWFDTSQDIRTFPKRLKKFHLRIFPKHHRLVIYDTGVLHPKHYHLPYPQDKSERFGNRGNKKRLCPKAKP